MAGSRAKLATMSVLAATTTAMAVSGEVALMSQPKASDENGRAARTIANEVPLTRPSSSSGVRG
jgi:hypothetical protein